MWVIVNGGCVASGGVEGGVNSVVLVLLTGLELCKTYATGRAKRRDLPREYKSWVTAGLGWSGGNGVIGLEKTCACRACWWLVGS